MPMRSTMMLGSGGGAGGWGVEQTGSPQPPKKPVIHRVKKAGRAFAKAGKAQAKANRLLKKGAAAELKNVQAGVKKWNRVMSKGLARSRASALQRKRLGVRNARWGKRMGKGMKAREKLFKARARGAKDARKRLPSTKSPRFRSGLRFKGAAGGGLMRFLLAKIRKMASMAKRGKTGDFRNHGFTKAGAGGRTGRRGFH